MATIDHQLLMALMDTVPDRIYFKDRAGRFLSVNKAMREFLQISDDSKIVGRTDFDIFLIEHAQDAFDDEQRIMTTGQPIVGKKERENLPDGRVTWVSTTKVPMRDESGQITGICGISRDMTEEHHQSEKLNQYTRALAEKQAQMEEDLILARQVQQALLPQTFPCFPREIRPEASALHFVYRYLPEALVGGDFFTVTAVSEMKAAVLVCDVMGHGVPAALVTAVQRVLVEELQEQADDPSAFLGELNSRLHHFFQPLTSSMFVTALYLVIDAVSGEVRYANAGHPLPLLVSRSDGNVRSLGLEAPRPPFALGVMKDSLYPVQKDTVHPGDLIFLYTDGLCDLGEGRELTPDAPEFLSLLRNSIHEEGEAFLDSVLAQARKFSGTRTFNDDVCLVGIEVKPLQTSALEV
jgi:sigma-B regulation protein RsbU (phosphoserine phosphatase)